VDGLTARIVDYAQGLRFDDLPPAVVTAVKQRTLDAIGCALGGRDCDAAVYARRLGRGSLPEAYPGRVIGMATRTSADLAAFANTAMIRYLDFNDSHQASHPSDMLGPLLALAEAAGADGRRLVSSIVVGYETLLRIVQASSLRERGWDQGHAMGIGTAAAVGHLLGLSRERMAHALAIATISNAQLRATRAGRLAMWKGAATADAGRNAVFTTLLAAEGLTGPDKPFEGRHGLWEQVSGPFDLPPFADQGGGYYLEHSFLKYWPVVLHAQAAIWAAIDLRGRLTADEIAGIDLATYWTSWHSTASEPEKWTPTTRETADHSMPYIFARTFLDGEITVNSFDEAAIRDPAAKALMDKIAVHVDDGIEALYRAGQPTVYCLRAVARRRSGGNESSEILHPRGMCRNPMSDAEIGGKFHRLAEPVLGATRAAAAAEAWLAVDSAANLTPAMALLVAE